MMKWMNLNQIIVSLLLVSLGIIIFQTAAAQLDPINDIEFIQTGKLFTDKNEFTISNDINVREFFDGRLIKITGYTVEGYPYITYSKITNEQIMTHGKIFTKDKTLSLVFDQQKISQIEKTEIKEKLDNISIVTQHTERVYSGQTAKINMKIFDSSQNRLNIYSQNYGYISNANINMTVLDKTGKVFFSSDGITDERGFFGTDFFIPKNMQSNTFTVIINAENDNSKSSKTIQIFNLGQVPDHDNSP